MAKFFLQIFYGAKFLADLGKAILLLCQGLKEHEALVFELSTALGLHSFCTPLKVRLCGILQVRPSLNHWPLPSLVRLAQPQNSGITFSNQASAIHFSTQSFSFSKQQRRLFQQSLQPSKFLPQQSPNYRTTQRKLIWFEYQLMQTKTLLLCCYNFRSLYPP